MTSLGIFGGAESLPAIAFNTKDNRQMPFSERLASTMLLRSAPAF